MSVKALYKEIRFTLRDLIYNSRCRKKLLNNDFSLITCDCTGGCVAKDLKVRMNSPTRNFILMRMIILSFARIWITIYRLRQNHILGIIQGGGQSI